MTAPMGQPEGAQGRRWLVLAAMTGSLSMIFIDMTVVGVALPRIGAGLGMVDGAQAWIVTSYLLTLASLMALGGRMGDLLGKVRAFLAGVVLFAVASVVCADARDGTQMIVGRVLQGIAACLMQPASGALVIGAFAPGERGKAMAAYVGLPLVFMAIGPAAGGWVVEHFGWPWVFWLNLPVAAAAIALTLVARPHDPPSADRNIDWLGGALLLAGLPAFVFGIQQLGPEAGAAMSEGISTTTIVALLGGAVVLAAFIRREWNHPRPLIRVRLFADRALAADAITIACMQFAMTGLVIAGSLYAQDVLGYSPTEAGLSLLPMLLPVILVVHVAGRWYDRAGARPPASLGTALATIGMLVQAGGAWMRSYPVMAAGMFLLGLGISLTMSPTNTDALGRVPHSERGQVSGLVQTMRQVGGSVGVATIAATVALSLAAFERGDPGLSHDEVVRIRSMLRSHDVQARIDAESDPLLERVRAASARSYAVGYAVASLGTLGAFIAVRRWMAAGAAAPGRPPRAG
ncbi:MAG: DHA2 family efflux MFS transporter permease subunit [Phycisphaerales bacterium]